MILLRRHDNREPTPQEETEAPPDGPPNATEPAPTSASADDVPTLDALPSE
jgi:hypothetical protein